MNEAPFRIHKRRGVDGRAFTLLYDEDGRTLEIYVEMTGLRAPYDWVASTQALHEWKAPAGAAIPESHQQVIRQRIEAWASAEGTSLGFEPPMTSAEVEKSLESAGCQKQVRPDGTIEWYPPQRS